MSDRRLRFWSDRVQTLDSDTGLCSVCVRAHAHGVVSGGDIRREVGRRASRRPWVPFGVAAKDVHCLAVGTHSLLCILESVVYAFAPNDSGDGSAQREGEKDFMVPESKCVPAPTAPKLTNQLIHDINLTATNK